jgi:branched-chain amino acid transport system ATP-binding protein
VAEPALLAVQSLSVAFGGVQAVREVSFELPRGTLGALIGPNGAGKTTLFGLISGFVRPDGGGVRFDGQDITRRAPHLIAAAGLARTFQTARPFAAQTVRENIAVGAYLRQRRRGAALAAADAVAAQVGLAAQLDKRAADLTVAARKRLELARALATRPKLLLLDEMLAGLNPSEIGEVLPVLRRTAEGGVTVLMSERAVQAVIKLAERVWVIAQGQLIASGTPAQLAGDERVIEACLGRGAAARLRGARP